MTYTEDEKRFIIDNYKILKSAEIGRILKRKAPAINIQAKRMGLARRGMFDYETDFDLKKSLLDPKFAYFLGFVWADGHLAKEKRRFGLSMELKADDGEFLKDFFLSLAPIRYKLYEKGDGYRTSAFYCRNKDLCNFLGENNYSEKSNCEPSKILSNIKEDLHIYFWKGVFDGDGSISIFERHRLVTFSANFDYKWEELTKFFLRLGISIKIKKNTRKYGRHSLASFCKRDWVEKFFKLMYPNSYDFGLKRKYDKFMLPPIKINCSKRWPRPDWEIKDDSKITHRNGS